MRPAGADTFISAPVFSPGPTQDRCRENAATGRGGRAEGEQPGAGMSIHFGTDGWRAVIAEDFTFQNFGPGRAGGGGFLERLARSRHGEKNHRRL